MFIGVHSCLPLVAAGAVEWWRVGNGRAPALTRTDLVLIAIAGLSPDILSPHLGLAARHASLTHTFWFPLLVAVGLSLVVFLVPAWRRWSRTAFFAWLGVVFHLACDLVSGGIPLLGTDRPIVGAAYVHFSTWLYLDAGVILVAWLIFFRVRFLAAGRKAFPTTCSWEEGILAWWKGDKPTLEEKNPGMDQVFTGEDNPKVARVHAEKQEGS